MSSSMYRRQLEQERKQRRDAESKVGNCRTKESTARASGCQGPRCSGGHQELDHHEE